MPLLSQFAYVGFAGNLTQERRPARQRPERLDGMERRN
jgi:hypothetical protein